MNKADFGISQRAGIMMASEYYFGKKIENLEEREIIGLYVISRRSGCNPIRDKKCYEKAVDLIIKRKTEA